MDRKRFPVIAGLVMAAGAAALAQPDRPGTQPPSNPSNPSNPSLPPARPEQPPGIDRPPPGQERTPPGQQRKQPTIPQISAQAVEQAILSWPKESQEAAKAMVQKYGPPNGMTPEMLVWKDNGPWKKTVVYAEAWEHEFPEAHKDVLLSVIEYRVPPDKHDDLAQFDGSIMAFRTPGHLGARCHKEEMNFLALNLAHEIVIGKRTVDDAREFLAQEARNFKEGRPSTYTQGLMFESDPDAADPDKPAPGGMSPSSRDPRDPMRPDPTRPDSTQPGRQDPGRPPATTPRPGQDPRAPGAPR